MASRLAWRTWMTAVTAYVSNAIGTMLDTVLPPRERTRRVRKYVGAHENLPLIIRSHTIGPLQVTTLLDYRTREVNDAIRALKYEGDTRSARLLATALADFLREEVATLRAFSPRPIVLIPVPLHTMRLRRRGFNQVERVLANLPEEFRTGELSHLSLHALTRIRATPRQTTLPRNERLRNLRGAFAANPSLVRHKHIILVDDVMTTGTTLIECAQTLKKAGGRVTAIALARA